MNVTIAAVITAAGLSRRMTGLKKEYRLLEEWDEQGHPLTVLGKAALAFASCKRIDLVVITVPVDPETGEKAARECIPPGLLADSSRPRVYFVPGGPTRRSSVHHALTFLESYTPEYILIHDGARPWLEPLLIDRIIDSVRVHKAVVPLLPLTDTPKLLDTDGLIRRHIRRAEVGCAQTPQAFTFPEILRAHEKAAEREERENIEYTDDAEVWGEFIGPVASIPGSAENRKITFPEDLIAAVPR
ncbi:2-C-methyl-D-erythritol 4-phosphate cytidylyltransferase [Spirochaetia bacterium]|nr:2-C-methyl-D-erythritol 4-phosphate cytidylyltransferase [Spirochaetia bacterium]